MILRKKLYFKVFWELVSIDMRKPFCRFLFWLSGGITSSIQRFDVRGQMKTTLIKLTDELKALTVDREDKRLFWVQFGLQGESAIASCDYNGKALHVMDQPLQWDGFRVLISNSAFELLLLKVLLWMQKFTEVIPINLFCFEFKWLFLTALSYWEYQFSWSTFTTLMLHLGL